MNSPIIPILIHPSSPIPWVPEWLKGEIAVRTGEIAELIKEWHFGDGTVRVTSYRTDDEGRRIMSSSGKPLLRATEYIFDWTTPVTPTPPKTEVLDPEDDIVDPDIVDG